jgi:hypothetical protein
MKVSLIVVAGAIVVGAILYEHRAKPLLPLGETRESGPDPDTPTAAVASPPMPVAPAATNNPQAGVMAMASNLMSWRKNSKSFTPEERAALEKKFAEKLKPAVEKWCSAYAGHVPFKPEDLTMNNFVERLGRKEKYMSYTFVLNGITISVRESSGQTVLHYIASGPEMHSLNQLPNDGVSPSLNVPVTREEIIRMVKADSGVEFQPSEIELRPTGAASALGGGAFVHIGHLGGDPNNGLCKLDFVFGPDGNIVNYERDPTF